MKLTRVFLIGPVLLVALIVVIVVGLVFVLDGAVKRGVEIVGHRLAKVPVQLNEVSLSLLSGSGTLHGLTVGNPDGFKTSYAIKVGTASLALQPRSLMANKIIIDSIQVEAPEITFETDLHGNNLSKILANIEESIGGSSDSPGTKKYQVNEFIVTGGKIRVSVTPLASTAAIVPLPEVRLKDLGAGPEGITAAELTREMFKAVLNKATQTAGGTASDLARSAVLSVTGEAQKAASQGADKLTESLGGLLKKKK